jgi:hypothetical protein
MKRFLSSFGRLPRVAFSVGVVALLGSLAVPARASTITLPRCTVSQLAHRYSSNPFGVNSISDFAESVGGSGTYTQPGFSTNMYYDDTVVFRVEALRGERFAYTVPTGALSAGFRVEAGWLAGSDSASFTQATPAITFEGLLGNAPTLNYNSNYVSDNGLRVGLEQQFDVTGNFSFTALEVSFPYLHLGSPGGIYPTVVNSYIPSLFLFSGYANGSSLSDQTVLAVVPEPSTYAMALAGLACGGYSLFRRRKQA